MRMLAALAVPVAIILLANTVEWAVFDDPTTGVGVIVFILALAGVGYGFMSARRVTSRDVTVRGDAGVQSRAN